jgi:hypothetical protein
MLYSAKAVSVSKDNITLFPISHSSRRKNKLGSRTVECIVTGRLLLFGEEATPLEEGSAVWVEVKAMAEQDKESRTICALAMTKEDIQRALDAIKVRDAPKR